ncbi:mpv17-like protein [Ptychodera flava]|uniref:mpv17-like protein n=1 Tax=Ptychodera flava TaxID=63121 RepID=UPI00396A66D8
MAALLRRIGKSHLIRNAVFLGTAYCVTESFQQTVIGEGYDIAKIERFGIWGLCFNGPAMYGWYKLLDGFLPGTTARAVTMKLCLDEVIMGPLFAVGFFIAMSAMEGKSDLFAEAKLKAIPAYLAGVAFWVPAQFINFRLVPPKFRVVYVGTTAFIWANILCIIKRQGEPALSSAEMNHPE